MMKLKLNDKLEQYKIHLILNINNENNFNGTTDVWEKCVRKISYRNRS